MCDVRVVDEVDEVGPGLATIAGTVTVADIVIVIVAVIVIVVTLSFFRSLLSNSTRSSVRSSVRPFVRSFVYVLCVSRSCVSSLVARASSPFVVRRKQAGPTCTSCLRSFVRCVGLPSPLQVLRRQWCDAVV